MVTIVETIYGEAAEHIVARMEGLGSATELVRAHVTAAAEYIRERRSHVAALGQIFANLRAADGSPRYGMHTSEELFAGLERMYRAGQASGEFREFDTGHPKPAELPGQPAGVAHGAGRAAPRRGHLQPHPALVVLRGAPRRLGHRAGRVPRARPGLLHGVLLPHRGLLHARGARP